MNNVTILIASPDGATRSKLTSVLSNEPGLRVIAKAKDLTETYANAEELAPNVALIDQSLIAAQEFQVIKGLFGALDIRWLAIDQNTSGSDPAALSGELKVTSDLFGINSLSDVAHLKNMILTAVNAPRQPIKPGKELAVHDTVKWKKIVLIGASTGGVDALIEVLRSYPENCPPTLIVQHTGNKLVESLALLLNRHCPATVKAVQGDMRLRSGLVGLAAARDGHLTVTTRRPVMARIVPGEKISGHAPSVDAMFSSAAPIASRVVGVLLTGMGKDGASGMLELRKNGGTTIAQDKATSVVYGMPRVAHEINAVQKQLPLNQICASIIEAASASPST